MLPDRTLVKGADSFDQAGRDVRDGGASPIEHYDLVEAFTREWPTDAHFVPYVLEPFDPTDIVYRLNKSIWGELIERGAVPVVYLLAIDLDTKDHGPWDAASWNEFHALLASLASTGVGRRLELAFASYPTRRGWRWVWRFSRGIPGDGAEPIIRGFIKELVSGGLPADQAEVLATWNCDFRLPRVVRDGVPTISDPFYLEPEIHADRFLDPDTIAPEGEVRSTTSNASSIDEEQPDVEEAVKLLWIYSDRGQEKMTDFCRMMKNDLHGKYYYSWIFEHGIVDGSVPPEANGSRHDALLSAVASAAGVVARTEGATIKHLFALFVRAAEQVAYDLRSEDPSRGDFIREYWKECKWVWGRDWPVVLQERQAAKENIAKEVEKKEEAKQAILQAEITRVSGEEKILAVLREGRHIILPIDPSKAKEEIRKRYILRAKGGRYHMMRPSGWYSRVAIDAEGIIPAIKANGMEPLMPIWVEGKQGPRPIKKDELAALYTWPIDRVEMRVGVEGGFLVDSGRDGGTTLVIPPYRRRRDVKPEFSRDVDLWLQVFGGKPTRKNPYGYEHLCLHVAAMLAFELGGCAAASFVHCRGSGKKMLTHGLLECMEEMEHADASDLVQRFNIKLATCPFLLVNEGYQDVRTHHYHPSDSLRRVLTGDYFQAESKGYDAIQVKTILRVLMTANHWRLIDSLGEGRDLSPQECDALGERICHYVSDGEEARLLLRERGCYDWTSGWIAGDQNEESKLIVAKHFLWLHEEYLPQLEKNKGRLLVEGSPDQEAIQRLRHQGTAALMVVETTLKMLDSPMLKIDGSAGVLIREGHLFVTVGAILDYWRANLTRGTGERLNAKRISLALRSLVTGEQGKMRSIEGLKERWNEIDVLMLAATAEKFNWGSHRLDELIKARVTPFNGNGSTNGNGIAAHAAVREEA